MTPYSLPLPRRSPSTSLLPDPWDINSQMMQPSGIKQMLNKPERACWFHSSRHGLSQVPVTELELVAPHGWAGYLCQGKWRKNTDPDRQISLRCDWMVWSSPKPSQIFTGDNDSAEFDRGDSQCPEQPCDTSLESWKILAP